MNIVIVEDDFVIANDIRQHCIRAGWAVLKIFSFGEAAVKAIPKLKPDLVLMNTSLKGKIDGIEAAERIMLTNEVPVVFLSGLEMKELLSRIRFTDHYGILLKPFSQSELIGAVQVAYADFKKRGNFWQDYKKFNAIRTPDQPELVGKIEGLIGEFSDGRSQENMTQLSALLRELNDNIKLFAGQGNETLMVIDNSGNILSVNESLTAQLGIDEAVMQGKSVHLFLDADSSGLLNSFNVDPHSFERKGLFLKLACRDAFGKIINFHCFAERIAQFPEGNCIGLIPVNSTIKKYPGLFDKIDLKVYESGMQEIDQFLQKLKTSITASYEEQERRNEMLNRQLRKSIYTTLGYADYMLMEMDNLSAAEIKELAGRVCISLKLLHELSEAQGG